MEHPHGWVGAASSTVFGRKFDSPPPAANARRRLAYRQPLQRARRFLPCPLRTGACGLGYQYKNVGTGWDVAAVADASPEFQGSCGWAHTRGVPAGIPSGSGPSARRPTTRPPVPLPARLPACLPLRQPPSLHHRSACGLPPCSRCYEVRCDPRAPLIDGEDHAFDRSSVCKEGAASVVVRTVDACELGCARLHASVHERFGVQGRQRGPVYASPCAHGCMCEADMSPQFRQACARVQRVLSRRAAAQR